MSKKKKSFSARLRLWRDAKKRYKLSHIHIQMARELGMNPKKLGKLDNHKQEKWKAPLPEFIENCYYKRFKKEKPDEIKTLDEIDKEWKKKKASRSLKNKSNIKKLNIEKMIVVLLDAPNYAKESSKLKPEELFKKMSAYYKIADKAVTRNNGRIIKYIGDGILIVFSLDNIDTQNFRGNLVNIKEKIEQWYKNNFYEIQLSINAHIGDVAIGKIKTDNINQYTDIFGKTVNETCMMRGNGLNISEVLQKYLNEFVTGDIPDKKES